MKKRKWPKFLTVKRCILFAIIIGLAAFVLIYFLGGYKPSPIEQDLRDFDSTGFTGYDDYYKIEQENVKTHNAEYASLIAQVSDATTYNELHDELFEKCETQSDTTKLKQALDLYSGLAVTERTQIKKELDNKALTDDQYARKLLDVFRKTLETDEFVYSFNYATTQFKIEAVERDGDGNVTKVINTWYSNPQNGDNDPYARGGTSTYAIQKSPVILSYITRSGAVIQLTSYEYAITDTIGTGDDAETVTPSFETKINSADNSIQVYYTFEKKGTRYSDFPKCISDSRWEELVENNKTFVEEQIAELEKYHNDGDTKSIVNYVNDHMSLSIITDYSRPGSSKMFCGVIAYNSLMKTKSSSATVDSDDYLTVINELEHDDPETLYELACEMVRTEYLVDYQYPCIATGKYIKDTTYLKTIYNTTVDEEAAIANGFELGCGYRECEAYKVMKKLVRNNLYQIFYTKFNYQYEDLENDQSTFNVEIADKTSTYKACVEYKLTDAGLTATLLTNSIYESDSYTYPVYKIDLLPYFTSEICDKEFDGDKYATSGGMIIPDGAGAFVSLNNGKVDYSQYSKKVYTTDLAFGSETKKTEQQDILLPMYAIYSDRIWNTAHDKMVANGYSILARIAKGAAQGYITANISKYSDSYNKIYFSMSLRESQGVTIGTGYYAKEITKFTEFYCGTDFVVDYNINNVTDETGNFTYSSVAKQYQEMLLKDGILSKEDADTTDDTVVNVELLGIYNYTDNFAGIVYNGHDTLTTLSQAVDIMKDMKSWGATNINLMYLGWRKAGLVNESFKNMKFGSKLGSKKDYNAFIDYTQQENINVYPVTSFLEINKYQDSFGKNRYSTRDVSSEYTKKYPYDLAGNIYDKKKDPIYTLSPKFFDKFADLLSTRFKKANPELDSMAFEKLGGKIVGDYKKHGQYFRYDSVLEQISALEIMQDNGIENISLTAPYEFAIKYAQNITELPYTSTLHEVFDYTIPFYQMVVSGYKDYSGLIINANDEKSVTAHLMDIFETGSNVEFTFSYDNSSKLIQTDYNYYYYTQYSQWEAEVKEVLSVLNGCQLHKYVLLSHEQYEGKDNVYVVTYANKAEMLQNGTTTDTFKVFLNYSDKEIAGVATKAGTTTLAKWSYYVDKEA